MCKRSKLKPTRKPNCNENGKEMIAPKTQSTKTNIFNGGSWDAITAPQRQFSSIQQTNVSWLHLTCSSASICQKNDGILSFRRFEFYLFSLGVRSFSEKKKHSWMKTLSFQLFYCAPFCIPNLQVKIQSKSYKSIERRRRL